MGISRFLYAAQAAGGPAADDRKVAEAIARFIVELTIAFVLKRILRSSYGSTPGFAVVRSGGSLRRR